MGEGSEKWNGYRLYQLHIGKALKCRKLCCGIPVKAQERVHATDRTKAPAHESINRWITESMNDWTTEPINSDIDEPIVQWINEQWMSEVLNRWASEPKNHWINGLMNLGMNEYHGWTNEWMNGGMDGWASYFLWARATSSLRHLFP